MAFPTRHYPVGSSLNDPKRSMYAGYGSVGAFDVLREGGEEEFDNLQFHCSKEYMNQRNTLKALGPTLPLLEPNQVDVLNDDVISDDLERKRREIQNLSRSLKLLRLNSHQPKVEKMEEILESINSIPKTPRKKKGKRRGLNLELPVWFRQLTDKIAPWLDKIPHVPHIHPAYTGGCLSCQTLQGDDALIFHPRNLHSSSLCVTKCSAGKHPGQVNGKILLETNGKGRLVEVDSIRDFNEVHITGRTINGNVVIWRLDEGDDCEYRCVPRAAYNFHHPSSVALNPHLPGECAVATEAGDIYLLSPNMSPYRVLEKLPSRFPEADSCIRCHYGGHPKQLVITDRTGIAIYDTRKHPYPSEDLFTLPTSMLNQQERVMTSMCFPGNQLYHAAATDYSLLLFDQRFPKHPVLTWYHSLESSPAYMDIVQGVGRSSAENVLLLGSQKSAEVSCFQFQLDRCHQDLPAYANDMPWKLSRPNDFLFWGLGTEKIHPSLIQQRLNVSLAGLCAIPTWSDTHGFTAFQATPHGDLFYQQYQPKDDIWADKTMAAGPGSSNIKIPSWCKSRFDSWSCQLQEDLVEDDVTLPSMNVTSACQSKNLVRLKTIFDDQDFPHILCQLCMSHLNEISTGAQDEPSASSLPDTECRKCGFFLAEAQQIRKARDEHVIAELSSAHVGDASDLGTEASNDFDTIDVSKYKDAFSQIMTKLYEDPDSDIKELLEERDKEFEKRRLAWIEGQKEKERDEAEEDDQVLMLQTDSVEEMQSRVAAETELRSSPRKRRVLINGEFVSVESAGSSCKDSERMSSITGSSRLEDEDSLDSCDMPEMCTNDFEKEKSPERVTRSLRKTRGEPSKAVAKENEEPGSFLEETTKKLTVKRSTRLSRLQNYSETILSNGFNFDNEDSLDGMRCTRQNAQKQYDHESNMSRHESPTRPSRRSISQDTEAPLSPLSMHSPEPPHQQNGSPTHQRSRESPELNVSPTRCSKRIQEQQLQEAELPSPTRLTRGSCPNESESGETLAAPKTGKKPVDKSDIMSQPLSPKSKLISPHSPKAKLYVDTSMHPDNTPAKRSGASSNGSPRQSKRVSNGVPTADTSLLNGSDTDPSSKHKCNSPRMRRSLSNTSVNDSLSDEEYATNDALANDSPREPHSKRMRLRKNSVSNIDLSSSGLLASPGRSSKASTTAESSFITPRGKGKTSPSNGSVKSKLKRKKLTASV